MAFERYASGKRSEKMSTNQIEENIQREEKISRKETTQRKEEMPGKEKMQCKWLPYLLVLASGCLWGCMGLLVRRLNSYGMDAMEIAWLRVAVAFLFMFLGVLVLKPSLLRIRWKDLWCFAGTGICSLSVFTVAYFYTMELTSLSVAAVLLYTAPAFVTAMSFFLFNETINRQKVIALCMAFVGCILVTGVLTSTPALTGAGILCGLLSGFGYALYSIFSRYAMQRGYGSITITVYTFLMASIALLPIIKVQHIGACLIGKGIGGIGWTVLMIFLVTVAPYLCYTKGLTGMENGRASVIASIEPVMATVIGILVFGESNSAMTWVGILLVIGSIGLISKTS